MKEQTQEDLKSELLSLCKKYDSLQDLYDKERSKNDSSVSTLDDSAFEYKNMVDNAPLSYQSLDRDARFVYVNEAWLKTLGYERQEVIGRHFTDFMTPDSAQLMQHRFAAFVETGKGSGFEFDMVRKDGTIITVEYDGKVAYDHLGNFKQTHCIFEDISKRKQAEEALRKSEEKYKFMFHDNPQPSWIFDTTTLAFLEVNEAVVLHYGYSREEFLSLKITEIRPPEDIPALLEDIKTYGLDHNNAGQWRHIKKNGELIYVDIITHPVVFDGADACHAMISDVTQRKHTEQALQQANSQLESLYNSLDEAIFSVDSQKNMLIYASKACEIIFNYPLEMYIAQPGLWYKLVIPEDRHIVKLAASTLANGGKFSAVFRKLDVEGELRWIEASLTSTVNDDGQLIKVDGIASDISKRKKVELELFESELNFSRSISESPVGIRIVSVEGATVYTNKAFLDIYDFRSLEEFRRTPTKDRYTEESYTEHVQRKIWRQMGREIYDYEISIRCRNGDIRYLKVTRKEIMWNATKHFQVINIDISKQRKAEAQLRKLSTAVEQSPAAICITDTEGMIEYANPKTFSLTGYSEEELIGVKSSIFTSGTNSKEFFAELWGTIKAGMVWRGELLNKKKNGQLYWESITISPIFDKKNRISNFLALKDDISELKKAEKALFDSQEQLRQFASYLQDVREEEKVALAREIHDDLGQILVALKIETGLLKLKVAKSGVSQHNDELLVRFDKVVDLIDTTIKTARRIMNGLRPELLEIYGFVGAIKEYIKDFELRNNLICKFDPNGFDFEMDKPQSLALFRIIQEALSNIGKHAKASVVSVTLRVEPDSLIMEIIDNGVGFDQNSAKRKDAYGMIGMNERVVLLNGNLEIVTKPGDGTKLMVTIPYRK